MNDKKQDEKSIIVQITSEMSNWMHPENDERKRLITKRIEDIKERYSKRAKKTTIECL